MEANDLRAGASLVIAGLIARGVTEISNAHFIDRGYEDIEAKLSELGADIQRLDRKGQDTERLRQCNGIDQSFYQ